MAIKKERCFPRGGQKSTTEAGKNKKIQLFDTRRKKKKEKSKEKKSKNLNNVPKEIIAAESLSYRSISDGMLLLGCVIGVSDYYVRLSLPCRLVGKVPLINISGPYTKILKSLLERKSVGENYYDLKQMFKIGQFVLAKVVKVTQSAEKKRHKVDLTLDPTSVNVNYTHSSVKNGMVLHGAVQSIEDHGYMIDFGIKSLRAFLKTKNAQKFIDQWNDGRPLGVGQLVPCLIQKVNNTSVASVAQVNADPKEVSAAVAELDQEINIHTLTPGTLVRSLVVENIRDGLMVEFLNFKGFVYRDHVGDPPPKLAAIRNARVLYTLPLLNTVYLSILLGNKDLSAAPRSEESGGPKVGQVIRNAQVVSASKRGLLISLGKYATSGGFVARKRLQDGEELRPERVKGLYSSGKELCVRIIGKDIMENLFICSAQPSIVNEQFFSIEDLKVGMKVTGTVLALKEKGLEVNLGKNLQLQGFVPSSHLADFPLQYPEKRFTKGKKVNGRVLRVIKEKGNVLLTLKPSLVDSDLPVICSYDQAANVGFADGSIVKIFEKGLIVAFYNDVKGFVSLSETGISLAEPGSLREAFYEGQSVRCRVITCKPGAQILLLSLLLNEDSKGKYYPPEIASRIGHPCTLKVDEVTEGSLVVEVTDTNDKNDSTLIGRKGMVPVLHLSDHASLTNCLLKTYKPGNEIASAILYSIHATNDMQPNLIFSLRPSVSEFCASSFGKHNSNNDEDSELSGDDENGLSNNEDASQKWVIEGTVAPCSVLEVNTHGLLLEAPIPNYGRRMFVPKEYIRDEIPETVEELGFVKNQIVFGKVMEVYSKKIILSTMLTEVWNGYDLEPGLALVKSYLTDMKRIHKHWKRVDKSLLGRFVEGQKVKGTVRSISNSGASIEVNKIMGNKIKIAPTVHATVIPHHYKKKPIKVGDTVVGRVIFVDHLEGQLHLTLNPKTIDEMEGTAGETLVVGKGVRAEILLCNKDVTLGFIKGNICHGELVYLPTRKHYNESFSFSTSQTVLKPGEIHKVIISDKTEGKMIALIKKSVTLLNKYNQGKIGIKRKKNAASEEVLVSSAAGEELPTRDKKRRKIDMSSPNEWEESGEGKMNCEIKRTSVKKRKISDDKSLKTNDLARKSQIVDNAKNNVGDESSAWEKLPRLQTTEDFVWDVDILSLPHVLAKNKEVDELSSEEEEVKETGTKGNKVKKKKDNAALREEEEARLREAEERLMDPETCPQTANDFDRLVLSSPDSSIIWLKYVAFHLQNTEIEKARAVAQRALKTINFREEQEKLNIWVCILNLENLYGTKESLEKVLQDAVQMNDAFKVYCQMLQIYLDSKKLEELDSLINVMLKKFRDQKEAWVQAGTICMKSNRPDKAEELLRRSFKSLPKRDHVDVICRWAQLEARSECGSVDRAQSLLEGVLAACPKRTDIWSSLTDTLIKAGRIEDARNVLERAVSQKLTVRKMKVLFKKYLSFEEAHGTPEGAARVRRLAVDYVEKGLTDAS